MSGCLYQLITQSERNRGSYFHVNGPYDKHGYVIRSDKKPNGEWLNLVRGTGDIKREVAPSMLPVKAKIPKRVRTFKGNNFKAISKFVSEMADGVVKVHNNLAGHRGYGAYTLISKTETEITIQNKNLESELITIYK